MVEDESVAIRAAVEPWTRQALATAILVAAKEQDRRPTSDGFEWYGSADEMAEGILEALRAGLDQEDRYVEPVRMTWDAEAGAIYVYAMAGYHGPVRTTRLFDDAISANIDRTPDGRLVGIEIFGIDIIEELSSSSPGPSDPTPPHPGSDREGEPG